MHFRHDAIKQKLKKKKSLYIHKKSQVTWTQTISYKIKGNNHFIVTPRIKDITIYSPTNALNVKNVELLKQFKIKGAAPCFGLQGNHRPGATAST